MASSAASSVEQYLADLPEDRRELVEAVRDVVNAHLPDGYQEAMQYGMVGWSVPHTIYPAGYHTDPKQPLPFAALASQKNKVSLYLMALYIGADNAAESPDVVWFQEAWRATGKKLDMGKSCVRFARLDQVPLEVVGQAIARIPVQDYIARYEASRAH
jgi:hypothetical protein